MKHLDVDTYLEFVLMYFFLDIVHLQRIRRIDSSGFNLLTPSDILDE